MSSQQTVPAPRAAFGPPIGESGLFYDPVLRLGISWLDTPPRAEKAGQASSTGQLVEAVAGIVAIAAVRARSAGEWQSLRRAVDQALGPPDRPGGEPATDPREAGLAEPPAISDAQPEHEAGRLAALMRRQGAG